MRKIIKKEQIPFQFSYTSLVPILCEAIVTDHMKPNIFKACPNIQVGGMPGSSRVEHLITLKTWMLMKEEEKQDWYIPSIRHWRNSLTKRVF